MKYSGMTIAFMVSFVFLATGCNLHSWYHSWPHPKATVDEIQDKQVRQNIEEEVITPLEEEIIIPLEEEIIIPEDDPHTITLQWKILSDYPPQEEIPGLNYIFWDGENISNGSLITGGKHSVEIRFPGYKTWVEKIDVPLGFSVYQLERTLESLPRKVLLTVRYDIPPSTLSWKAKYSLLGELESFPFPREAKLKPGRYEFMVEHPHYESVRWEKSIFPASIPEEIIVNLQAKNRNLKTQIEFDIPPFDSACLVNFIDTNTGVRHLIPSNGKIHPGNYEYIVEKPGYLMPGGNRTIHITPGVGDVYIRAKMKASARQISFDMIHQEKMREAREIFLDGEKYSFSNKYRPGKYRVVAHFNQFDTVEMEITISPGVGVYTVVLPLQKAVRK